MRICETSMFVNDIILCFELLDTSTTNLQKVFLQTYDECSVNLMLFVNLYAYKVKKKDL